MKTIPVLELFSCKTRGRLVQMPAPRGRKSLKTKVDTCDFYSKTKFLTAIHTSTFIGDHKLGSPQLVSHM